jgi:hypothetical protein
MITDEEFIELWSNNPSIVEMSKITGVSVRNVAARRRRIEERHTIKLAGGSIKSPDFQVTYAQNNIRTKVDLHNGVIVVASDCHYWPGIVSTAHRALVKIIGDLKPKMVVINGDAFDGASISRHPPIDKPKKEFNCPKKECKARITEL